MTTKRTNSPADHTATATQLSQPPTRWLAGRLYSAAILVLALLIVAGGYLLIAPRTTIDVPRKWWLSGEVNGETSWLQIEQSVSPTESHCWAGTLDQQSGTTFQLAGASEGSGTAKLRAFESLDEPPWKQFYGSIVGDFNSGHDRWQGSWQHASASASDPLTLIVVAEARVLTRTVGYRVGGRGRQITYTVTYPQFIGQTPLDQAAARELDNVIQEDLGERAGLPWHDWQDFYWSITEATMLNEWEHEDEWSITIRTDRIISLLCDQYSYTGGAHGNASFQSLTLWRDGDEVHSVELDDLFVPESAWKGRVAELCGRDLTHRRGFATVVKHDVIGEFTVHPIGLAFHFPKYSIGSGAEGVITVVVPYTDLRDILRTDGPAAELPARADPKGAAPT